MIDNDLVKGWRSVLHELRKQNPSVFVSPLAIGAPDNYIQNTRSTKILFIDSGKPVSVYKTYLWSAYTDTVAASLARQPDTLTEGIRLNPPSRVFELPVEISELYIQASGFFAPGLGVNRPVSDFTPALGPMGIWAFTTPEYQRDDDA